MSNQAIVIKSNMLKYRLYGHTCDSVNVHYFLLSDGTPRKMEYSEFVDIFGMAGLPEGWVG